MGWCIWITGLPGSGKSTIARKLKQKLDYLNVKSYIISSDALRKIATPKPKYTEEEREIIYGALVYAAKVLVENGINVIIDATGNRRRYREKARNTINRFMEVYLKCPLSICIERERKRLETYMAPRRIYEKAFTGESKKILQDCRVLVSGRIHQPCPGKGTGQTGRCGLGRRNQAEVERPGLYLITTFPIQKSIRNPAHDDSG